MVKQIIMHSDKVEEPTLVMLIPIETSEELKVEIEDILLKNSDLIIPPNKNNENDISIATSYEMSGNKIELRTKDVRLYLAENNLEFNGRKFEGDDNDWLFIFPKMITKSKLQLMDNPKFQRSLEYTLFSALLGFSIAIGGEMKSPGESMVGIDYNRLGLIWLSYPAKNMRIILRKGMYNEVDQVGKVIYSRKMEGLDKNVIEENQLRDSTFGEYPYYLVEDLEYDELDDPDYIRDLIIHASKLQQ